MGQHLGDQPVARRPGDDMHLPGLDIGARRGQRRLGEQRLDRGARHRIGPEGAHRAAGAQGVGQLHRDLRIGEWRRAILSRRGAAAAMPGFAPP